MGFASSWLDERAIFPEIIKDPPDKKTGIIVVVPAFNEPCIEDMLDSLQRCNQPACSVEVIIVLNAPRESGRDILAANQVSLGRVEKWQSLNSSKFFRLYVFIADTSLFDRWGVGLARKTGMDEAVRRFDTIGRPDGVILNLDADCRVEINYFTTIYEDLLLRKDRSACSVYFEHPVAGSDFSEETYRSVCSYELHLRYIIQAVSYTGFPYAYHTVGSAMAVKALPYIKAGGMNRRQAGEDFYFIQKLVQAGGYFNLNTTTVFPSPRISSRVPFGTGAAITKMIGEGITELLSYDFTSFKDLKYFFSMVNDLCECRTEELSHYYGIMPEGLRSFVDESEWRSKIIEIRANTSGPVSFRKRFYSWFNMFKIIKYLNFVHSGLFIKTPVEGSAVQLLQEKGYNIGFKNSAELLGFYRKLDREN